MSSSLVAGHQHRELRLQLRLQTLLHVVDEVSQRIIRHRPIIEVGRRRVNVN